MKIDKIELFAVPPRWLFLKITTDSGLAGWGEPVVEGQAETVRSAIIELSDKLIGKDPRNVEDLYQAMSRGTFYHTGPVIMSAIAGVDQALWDIKARDLGLPIYALLGGAVRNKMRVYAWIGGDAPADVHKSAKEQIARGYTAVKMNATGVIGMIDMPGHVDDAVARLASAREAVGPNVGIGIDFHGRVHRGMAKALVKELEQFHPLFYEEPVLPENNDCLPEIAKHTSVPIATGERMYSRWDFKQVFAQGAVDIIQPDLSHAGGIWEVRKIAAMAEAYDVAVAPHCPLGPIALASCLQLDFCTPNAFIQEQSLGIHYNQGSDLLDYLKDPTVFHYKDGFVPLLPGPGLGIEINEDKVREMAKIGHQWHNPVWRTDDGNVVDW